MNRRSMTLSSGAPQRMQHPLADVEARMQGSTSLVGKVAKWASGNGSVEIDQTERLFLVPLAPALFAPHRCGSHYSNR